MSEILIIDDNDQLRMSFQRLLEEEGYTVRTAASGEFGLAMVKESLPNNGYSGSVPARHGRSGHL